MGRPQDEAEKHLYQVHQDLTISVIYICIEENKLKRIGEGEKGRRGERVKERKGEGEKG